MDSVAVLTPVYNASHFLTEYRDTISSQTLQPEKIYIVDDGSTDDTPALLSAWAAEDPRVSVLRFNSNRGRGAARQALLNAAETKYVSWLDVDDSWHPEKLAVQLADFKLLPSTKEHILVGPLCQVNVRSGGFETSILPRTYTLVDYLRVARDNNIVAMLQASFGKTSSFLSVGFDRTSNWSEDFDFFLRFLGMGGVIVPEESLKASTLYRHDITGRSPSMIAGAHDYIYSKNSRLWPSTSECETEKWLRRIRYVLYASMVNMDDKFSEEEYLKAQTYFDSNERYKSDLKSAALLVLKSKKDNPEKYLQFFHKESSIGKQILSDRRTGGYQAFSSEGHEVKWKFQSVQGLSESIGESGFVSDQDVLKLFLGGTYSIYAVERKDAGRKRFFKIEAIKRGMVAIVPQSL